MTHLSFTDPSAHVVRRRIERIRRRAVMAPVSLTLKLPVHATLVYLVVQADTTMDKASQGS